MPTAHFYLGLIYHEGAMVKQDPQRAIDHYVKGAAKNNAWCYFALHDIYSRDEFVPYNEQLSFLYLKRSAEEGYVVAQHQLGTEY